VGLLCLLASGACQPTQKGDVLVFAAASLTDVAEALADSFAVVEQDAGVRVSVAASSILARQISAGAAPDVFFAASVEWMAWLDSAGRLAEWTELPYTTTLALVGRPNSARIDSPGDLLKVKHIAMADPEHVPAGEYARRGLECLGLWNALSDRVVPTLDVRAALAALASGAAEAAVVYASDLEGLGDRFEVASWPAMCAQDIRFAVGLPVRSPAADLAARFVSYALAPERLPVWTRLGFTPIRP
jgi:molybdate transport system substrate-binding protein